MAGTESLRILHRVNLNVAGGVENQFRAFVTHPPVRRRLVNEVLVGEPVHPHLAPEIEGATRAIHSFKRWHGLAVPGWPRGLRSRRAAGIIRSVKPDGLLSWSAFAKPELAAACRRANVPLLYREGGGAWGEIDPDRARLFLTEVRHAFCNTYASMRMLQLRWGYAGAATVCRGGGRPDLVRLSGDAPPAAERERPRVGMAVRLAHEKGVGLALHALALLRERGLDADLWIAGYGEEEERLKARAAELGVAERARFLGNVADMAGFYRDIDVLLHPALQEPLGNATIEASVFGRTVVASRVAGLAATVRHGETGYSVPATGRLEDYGRYGGGLSRQMSRLVYDPDADDLRPPRFVEPADLAAALAPLLGDAALRQRFGSAARAHVLENFSYDRHIEAITAGIVASLRG